MSGLTNTRIHDAPADECGIEIYIKKSGKEKRIIVPRACVVPQFEEGDTPDTSILTVLLPKEERQVSINVSMGVDDLYQAIYDRNIKAGTYKDKNLINLTEYTKGLQVFRNAVHVLDNLFAAPEDASGENDVRLALTFNEAAKYAQKMNTENYLGYSDWRVPTIEELRILTKYKDMPSLKDTFSELVCTDAAQYWSSEPRHDSKEFMWNLSPHDGHAKNSYSNNKFSVRLVRVSAA